MANVTITLNFDAQDPETLASVMTLLDSTLPYMVDNIETTYDVPDEDEEFYADTLSLFDTGPGVDTSDQD